MEAQGPGTWQSSIKQGKARKRHGGAAGAAVPAAAAAADGAAPFFALLSFVLDFSAPSPAGAAHTIPVGGGTTPAAPADHNKARTN